MLKERGEKAFLHAVACDQDALGILSDEAGRRVAETLEAAELSQAELEIIYAQRGAGHFTPEIADVKLGYLGEQPAGPGVHFTVSVIDHPLSPRERREIPLSFSPEEIASLIEELSLPEDA